VDFLIVGNGMFGAATARYLAPYAKVTVVGPEARADGSRGYGAHHDEGRIIGDLSRDIAWSELNRRARDGMTKLDPALITPCGALTVTTRDGRDYLSVADQLRQHRGADIRTLTADAARAGFPMARFGPDETILHQPAAGHFNPRRYVTLATQSSQGHGAAIISGTVRALRSCATGIEAELGDGRLLRAETAIVASGAFAAGSDLLPAPVALRAKSEIYAMAELDDQQAAALSAMPCITRTISHPQLADLYVLPPIRYPDGRTYLKFGANTVTDRWLLDPAAVRAWYDHGDGNDLLPGLRGILAGLLPDARIRFWHTRRCADAYTAHRRPYIDVLEPGRLIIALGGNGRGAQACDAVGDLTARLALGGQWPSSLPRDAFRHVPAHASWNGMTLLASRTGRRPHLSREGGFESGHDVVVQLGVEPAQLGQLDSRVHRAGGLPVDPVFSAEAAEPAGNLVVSARSRLDFLARAESLAMDARDGEKGECALLSTFNL
jgi:sarcosine oxidase